MNKNRMEALTDGVFAVVITLLVFDIKIPKVDYDHLGGALVDLLPRVGSYMYSFIIIGIYWISHHNISRRIEKIDGIVIWGNILLLLFVCFIPFTTSLLGQYPMKPLPVLIYGCSLLLANMVGYLVWAYVSWCHRLIDPATPRAVIFGINKSFFVVNALYLVAIGLCYLNVYASYALFVVVLLYIVLFRTENLKGEATRLHHKEK